MKIGMFTVAALLAAGIVAGCGGENAPSTTTPTAPTKAVANVGKPLGSIKIGDSAICVVCAKGTSDHASSPEPSAAVIDYKGKTYAFCAEGEKAEFISNPAKYADPSP